MELVNLETIKKKLEDYLEREKSTPFFKEAKLLKENFNKEELLKRFKEDLKFGTGGMRGIIGAGSSYMNPYNVKRATQALCNYIKGFKKGEASHNPPAYNGYKAYWCTGGQLTPPHDEEVVKAFALVNEVKELSEKEALESNLLIYLKDELDELYLKKINESLPNLCKQTQEKKLRLVYTPLHGIGGLLVDKLYADLKEVQVYKVEQQIKPNGDFPSLKYPNPEEPSAYALAINLADQVDADLIIANDPDADRMGCQTKNPQGEWVFINGNQIGCLFLDYLLRHDEKASQAYLTNSIVTTDLQERIADYYSAHTIKTLTGFKWMALEVDRLKKERPELHLALATEESYGFFSGDYTRDKDALLASKLLVEITLWLKQRNLSLLDYLEEIWKKVGFYQDALLSKTYEGLDCQVQRERIMKRMREESLTHIGRFPISYKKDYWLLEQSDQKGSKKAIEAKFKTDALEFVLEGQAKFSLRPSGTEPKIKMYLSAWGTWQDREKVVQRLNQLKQELEIFLS
ncbi:UNVERIFIED_CONTAM: hypothetical protein PYX00_010980 [Menopon gallinae]|uniref:Phosphoglucomutase n=1 Tax=Menopon gallinae TaxID=328185 RepID=A0AAW2H6Z6_9NEOP